MSATFHDDLAGAEPLDPGDARALQRRMAGLVRADPVEPDRISTVAGLDVSYAAGDTRLVAAAVVLSLPELRVVDSATAVAEPRFPYVPGLFAFREVPPLLDAIGTLSVTPDVFVCDGFGVAHPRRFGLASHLGVLLERRTLGVGKSPFVGYAEPPAAERGSWSPLVDDGAVVGRSLRTRSGVRPVYVSVRHRVDLGGASELVLRLAPEYRLPEPIRHADRLSRDVLADRAPQRP
ncbi:deoxyribonuclease V [Lipingzhangella halophila]|uniref:Endonuclease V n=1 Tax=Lipingzhangella halophila TaxID=1783352 RepID=A0A7W7W399_9ACTN|nr:endonuclease V [Lipingzhangella halophila]MBB4931515.1 deoxyribonuclease V [Lipingzhangella halophila]